MSTPHETWRTSSTQNLINQGQLCRIEYDPFTIEDVNDISSSMFVDNVGAEHFPLLFDVKEGHHFRSKKHLQYILSMVAVRRNQYFRVTKSDRSRVYVKCIEDGCTWKLKAYSLQKKDTTIWKVKSYKNTHSCVRTVTSNKHPQAKSAVVSECLKVAFEEKDDVECVAPKQIQKKILKEHGVRVSYYTAWRAKELCLNSMQGNAEESYAMLPKYAEALREKNPGTYTAFNLDDQGKFKYFFLSFGVSIEAWKHCRPVLSVDGTFLKNKYKGILIMAAAMDGNNHIFPIACSIVDAEDDDSWLWFFKHLKNAIGKREDLVIISDRKSSIPSAISCVYPEASQGICTQHLYRNVLSKFKKASNEILFEKCVWAYTTKEFDHYMNAISSIDARMAEYLIEADPTKWAKSHCTRRRYDVMTTNISECLNAVLKAARDRPIVSVVEAYRKLCQTWINKHRLEGASMHKRLTPRAEFKMDVQEELARTLTVDPINEHEYEVLQKGFQYVVNLNCKTCTCNAWQLDDFPCAHAMASLWMINCEPKDHVSKYYTRKAFVATYSGGGIYPSGYEVFCETLSDTLSDSENLVPDTLPPEVRRQPGRPKKKRIPSVGEYFKKSVYCGACGKKGHNKRRCLE